MQAIFGFNKDLPGGVHSLFSDQREAIVYPASHTLVFLNCSEKKQIFMQGHADMISAVAVSNDKRWIVSGDVSGFIIIWDSMTLKPIRTYKTTSVLRIDLSDDGSLIAILTDIPQKLQIFEWNASSDTPSIEAKVPEDFGFQRDIRFNPADFRELISNSAYRTVFWQWEEHIAMNQQIQSELTCYSPEQDFKSQPSAFTVSCFLPKTTAALTGTVSGEVVLYDIQNKQKQRSTIKLLILHTSSQSSKQIIPSQEISAKNQAIMLEPENNNFLIPGTRYFESVKNSDKEAQIKLFYQYMTQAQNEAAKMTSTATQSFTQAITYMHAKHDGFIVTGGLDGAVRMFDFRLRLLSWYENLESGPITSISIVMPVASQIDNQLSQAAVQLLPGNTPRDMDKQEQLKQQFGSVVLRDFIVGTQRGTVILVPAAVFELVEPEKRRGQVLYQGIPGDITASLVPKDMSSSDVTQIFNIKENAARPIQYIATNRGDIIMYDYSENKIIQSVNLVGDINASDAQKLKGTLAQRHQEGFEQASYLVPVHPLEKIKTMRYCYITAIELFCQVGKNSILICGTSLGTCLLLDPITLQLLSQFVHLSTPKLVKVPDRFHPDEVDVPPMSVPVPIKYVKISQGDVVAAVDENNQLTILYKTATVEKKMDLVTGKVNQDKDEKMNNSRSQALQKITNQEQLQISTLQATPKFVTEFEEAVEEDERRTAAGVRIHPAAMLARANQRKRDAAQTAGQWQNLGRLQVSHTQVVGCEFYPFNLYDEFKNEEIPRQRDPLVLISKDRFITIVDIQRTIAIEDPNHIIVDRRFRTDQEAIPTAMCLLKKPKLNLDDQELLAKDLEKEQGKTLKNEVNRALLSLQCSTQGPVCAALRPDLQPVDQRDLLIIANNQYKIQLRTLQRFVQCVELSNRTIVQQQNMQQPQQQYQYFQGGFQTQYPLIPLQSKDNNYFPSSQGFVMNSRLAGPLPLRRTILGPTFAGYISQFIAIEQYMSDKDKVSVETVGQKQRYRTDYEVLNSAGAVKHRCQYIAFATPEKVIGMMRTPLDGAPHRYVGLIVSAGEILQIDASYCQSNKNDQHGQQVGNTYIVSSGKTDCCSFLFQVDYPTLDLMIDTAVNQDFASFDPFLNQLKEGAQGEFYKQIQEYFSYAQISSAESKGLSPSENARAPVNMLGEMLRALGVHINNEQIANAIAEITEEEVRTQRLNYYLQVVKRAVNKTNTLPAPFNYNDPLMQPIDIYERVDLKPFFDTPEEDLAKTKFDRQPKDGKDTVLYSPYWNDDNEKNEMFEHNLWEVVGGGEITLSLQDFIRILVNYRPIARVRYRAIKEAFEILGAKGAESMLNKKEFDEKLIQFGEAFLFGDLKDEIEILNDHQSLPDHIKCEDFATKCLGIEISQDEEQERQEDQEEEPDDEENEKSVKIQGKSAKEQHEETGNLENFIEK